MMFLRNLSNGLRLQRTVTVYLDQLLQHVVCRIRTLHIWLFRQSCVQYVASHWDRYALYANFCHRPDVPDAPLANPADPLSLFPTPVHYQNYMNIIGKWGTQLEINVLAEILRTPILVWKLETRKAMDIINYNPTSNVCANTIHIVHCNGNHYEALSHRGGASINEILTHELARQQAQERTLIVIPNHDPGAATRVRI